MRMQKAANFEAIANIYLGNTLQRGVDSFTFEVRDNVGGVSQALSVIINITHINHSPVAQYTVTKGMAALTGKSKQLFVKSVELLV